MSLRKSLGLSNATLASILSVSALLALFVLGCDKSTSPSDPEPQGPNITYKRPAIEVTKNVAMVPDSVISTGGSVSAYAVDPALPAGLTLNAGTGIISGTASALYPVTSHVVTATGSGGTFKKIISVCVGDATHPCDTLAPDLTYYSAYDNGPGFMWTSPNTALKPLVPFFAANSGPIDAFTVNPALPAGVSLNASTGVISGTPTDTAVVREYFVVATGPFGHTDTAKVYLGVFPQGYPFALLAKGLERWQESCSGCHGTDGQGSRCPPLHQSDYLMAQRLRPIRIQMLGLPNMRDTATTIYVKGEKIEGNSMFAPGGNDSTIAGATTFIRAYLMNGARDYISVQEVGLVRDSMIAEDTGHKYSIDPH